MEEAFVARRPALRLLVVPQRRAALEKLVLHATNLRIPIVEVEGGSLTAIAGFDGHQGIALVVEPRRFAGIDDILARATERGEPPFVLVLDSLEDPHNVGSLLRSAEAAGVHGVIFPMHRQAPLSPSAVKSSAGAVEHLLLCPVEDLPGALSDLHLRGLRIAGADGAAPMTARQSDLRGPLAIVVGSEGQGLGPAVRRRCDLFVRISMRGRVGSLNAAVAGSILVFEAVNQRDPSGGPPVPAPHVVGEGTIDPDVGADVPPTGPTLDIASEAPVPGDEPEGPSKRPARPRRSAKRPAAESTTTDAGTTTEIAATSTAADAAPTTDPEAPKAPRTARARKASATSATSGEDASPAQPEEDDLLPADAAAPPPTAPRRRRAATTEQPPADPPEGTDPLA